MSLLIRSQERLCAPGNPGRSFRPGRPSPGIRLALALGLAGFVAAGCAASQSALAHPGNPGTAGAYARESPFVARPLHLFLGKRWVGNAIAYGPHRDGQRPGGPSPTREQIREDLHRIARHWGMIRLYGSVGSAETILEVIHEDRLELGLLLGIWIDAEDRRDSTGAIVDTLPEARAANRREIESAVRLAAAYPGIVLALSVGNETQIFWSSHRVPEALLIGYVREMRARTRVPVTTGDDYNYWNKPASQPVAAELDFVMMHAHPLWNGLQVAGALDWTKQICADVQAAHPGKPIVLGETGWATQKHNEGEQATLIKGEPGEEPQKVFFEQLSAWVDESRVPTFWFEAFDENWKGGAPPDEVEKHWGLYRADRTPKKAMAGRDAP